MAILIVDYKGVPVTRHSGCTDFCAKMCIRDRGKSTLMKILIGVYSHDGGTIKINDQETVIDNYNMAREKGISLISVSYTHLDVYKRQVWKSKEA